MSNRILVVGAGRIGTDLIRRLSEKYEITCVDREAESLQALEPLGQSRPLERIQGDATSRLVLEQARVETADLVVLTVTTEAVNLETARVLREKFRVPRILSIGITPAGIRELERLQVEVANIFEASSHSLLNLIQSAVRTPQGIGTGQGEVVELTVHPRSRLLNKPLRRLVPLKWRIGLIYRAEEVLVPDGDTRLRPKDRVIVMGDPSVVQTVSQLLTFSTHDFPLEYGTLALVYIGGNEGEAYFGEVEYLLNSLPFGEAVFMLSPTVRDPERYRAFFDRCPYLHTLHSAPAGSPLKAILAAAGMLRRNCGLVIGERGTLFGSSRSLPYRTKTLRLLSAAMDQLYAPFLFCAGSFPYARAAVPALPQVEVKDLLETALEVTSQMAADLSVFHCSPSAYTGSEEEKSAFQNTRKTVSEMGLLYKRKIATQVLSGNPIHEILPALEDHHLLLLEPSSRSRRSLVASILNPDPVIHILARSPVTTLLQPREGVKKGGPAASESAT